MTMLVWLAACLTFVALLSGALLSGLAFLAAASDFRHQGCHELGREELVQVGNCSDANTVIWRAAFVLILCLSALGALVWAWKGRHE